jgi:uncharacterized protein YfaP (DUF2135 family)
MKNGRSFLHIVTAVLLIVPATLLLSSCESGSGFYDGDLEWDCSDSVFSKDACVDNSGGTIVIPPSCDSNDPGIVDGCGEAITDVDIHDPVIINLQGLAADTAHTITITDPTPTDISTLPSHAAGSAAATSDSDGNIYMATIVQNMTDSAVLGDYTVTVHDLVAAADVQSWTYTVGDLSRVQCADGIDPATANPKASYSSGENVFAVVNSSLTDGDYNVYVLSDIQTAIPDGGIIPGTPTTITLAGGLGGVNLGVAGTDYASGTYDVLVDANGNGYYNRGTDLISRHARLHPCFAIQAANSGAADQIAADQKGNRREIFDPDANKAAIRDVFASVTPKENSSVATPGTANVYVVTHRDSWTGGEALVDLSGTAPPEVNNGPVQNNTNAQGNMLQWSFTQLGTNPGCYDLVVDTDDNGVYTAGTDYVDNVNHLGDNTDCGFRVSTPDNVNVTITSHTDNEVTTATAIQLSGTVSGPLTAAYIRITSGTQTNIISLNSVLPAGGAFTDISIPLFSGDNYITVSGVYNATTSRSETIMVRSVTDLALFRAQLTWDGSTDMDLHLVRPGGTYTNGGGGADDCNYGNCNVGLAGTGSNSIDWGNVGEEADDPKLDVDCISCGNGIENIWMNQTNEDGTYKVYVDAFSGNENDSDVIVTISILGSTVGQVNCGNMAAGTATDSCYVGDINWTGGTSGAGSFTAVGTLAADF